jgi:hypothetical protein
VDHGFFADFLSREERKNTLANRLMHADARRSSFTNNALVAAARLSSAYSFVSLFK